MKKFSSPWWNNFLEESDNLQKVLLKKNVLSKELKTLNSFADEVFTSALQRPDPMTFRVWVNDNPIDKNDNWGPLIKDVDYTTVEELLTVNRGIQSLGIIQNYCETLSEPLKEFISKIFSGLFEKQGLPTHGNEITLFAGNYSRTPIGFHLDQKGHQVIHLHIGPGNKTMYLIPKAVYENNLRYITKGQSNFMDVDVLIPYATKYIIEPGDLFFMPHGFYHVGRNDGFSKAVTIWLENMDASLLAQRLLGLLSQKIFSDDNQFVIKNDKSDITKADKLYQQIKPMLRTADGILDMTVGQLLKQCLLEYKYAIVSNNYFVPRSIVNKFNISSIADIDTVIINDEYRLMMIKERRVVNLFWMGVKISLPNTTSILSMIREIQKGKPVPTKKLIKILNREWEEDASITILNSLAERKIILNHIDTSVAKRHRKPKSRKVEIM